MKKLTWRKKKYDDLTVWVASVKPVDWEFAIEQIDKEKYQAFVYYGSGNDERILPYGTYMVSLTEAQRVCNDWLHNIIIGLNKWI